MIAIRNQYFTNSPDIARIAVNAAAVYVMIEWQNILMLSFFFKFVKGCSKLLHQPAFCTVTILIYHHKC